VAEEGTGMDDLNGVRNVNGSIYDLQGRKLSNREIVKSTNHNVYIQNGNKWFK
jgi:hypothetical protein